MEAEVIATPDTPYVLGHSTHELDRLIHQARFRGDLTEHVMHLAERKVAHKHLLT